MEYILIFILQVIGISLHIMQSIMTLGNQFPKETPKSIIKIFWSSDWDSLIVSGIVLILNEVGHYVLHTYAPKSITGYPYFDLINFGVALILGYAGQSLIYKFLGRAQQTLENNANKLADKLN